MNIEERLNKLLILEMKINCIRNDEYECRIEKDEIEFSTGGGNCRINFIVLGKGDTLEKAITNGLDTLEEIIKEKQK